MGAVRQRRRGKRSAAGREEHVRAGQGRDPGEGRPIEASVVAVAEARRGKAAMPDQAGLRAAVKNAVCILEATGSLGAGRRVKQR